MAQKTVIIDIIKGLDRSQAAYIRARLRGQKRALYDFYYTSKNPQNLIDAVAAINVDGNRLASLKAKLENEIARILGEYARKGAPKEMFRDRISYFYGYIGCQEAAIASHYLQAAFNGALDCECFESMNEAGKINDLYFSESGGVLTRADRDKMSALAAEFRAIEKVLEVAENVKSKGLVAATELELELSAMKPPVGKKARILFLRAKIICLAVQHRFVECRTLAKVIEDLWVANSWLLFDPLILNSIIASTNVIAATSDDLVSWAVGIDLLTRSLELAKIQVPSGIEIFKMVVQLNWCRASKDIKQTDAVLVQLARLMDGKNHTDERRLTKLVCMAANVLIFQRRPEEALEWIHKVYKRKSIDSFAFWAAVVSIMELSCHYSNDNYEELLLAIRRAKRRLLLATIDPAYIDIIVKTFTALASNASSPKRVLLEMKSAIDGIAGNDGLQLIIESFDLRVWAEGLNFKDPF